MTEHSTAENGERLLQLSNEVSRIAGDLARLTTAPSPFRDRNANGNAPEMSAQRVMATIQARRARVRYFPEDLFADPAWDMMLNLLHAELTCRRVTVSSLCRASEVPATTALRWISAMIKKGFFVREADPHDGRRFFIELTQETSDALRGYFAEIGYAPAA